MQLFAIGAIIRSNGKDLQYSRQIIEQYLSRRLNKDLTAKYLILYDKYVDEFLQDLPSDIRRKKRLSAYFVKVLKIAETVNTTLEHLEKVVVLIRLIEFFSQEKFSSEAEDFISTVANIFNIDRDEFLSIKNFIRGKFEEIPLQQNLLYLLPAKDNSIPPQAKVIYDKNIDEKLVFLFIKSAEILIFRYYGSLALKVNSRQVDNKLVFLLDRGAIIRGPRIRPVYQTQIIRYFLDIPSLEKVHLVAKNIEFRYPGSDNGIHKFSFDAESGQLIGILGASGAGKSTLINILIGKYKIHSGSITINGYDLYRDRKKLIPLIGYVPQDDLLIEELTVYQNIYYSAKLCFGNHPDQDVRRRVEDILKKLDLWDIRDLKVGNPLNKYISGGQRKRLNIALELIREPSILFVDEPTSGLSSMDSENVMHLLKRQAVNGRLVIVNIHQPSSDIFKLFDEIIVLDRGGYPAYKGNPLDGIIYFKQVVNYADADIAECPTCGNVNPDLMLEIIEDRMVDEFGRYTPVRRTTPKEWYILYRVNLEVREKIQPQKKTSLPEKDFNPPSFLKQFWIFVQRDLLSKLSDTQYMIINLLEAPLLAFILAFFVRTPNEDGVYVFIENHSLPIFLFMAVIVALFLGLSLSAEEIIKDRKILEREKFLQLSRFSYLNSKVLILFVFSAYQTLSFILISDWILQIHGLTFKFWLILLATAMAANMLGLWISDTLDSIVAIYITIPLLLVPQMLLGGIMINFDDLPPQLTNKKYTPFIADIMFSRWGYEAMAVVQFKDNLYEKQFFDLDKQKSDAIYMSSFYIPELKNIINSAYYAYKKGDKASYDFYLGVLRKEFKKMTKIVDINIALVPEDMLSSQEFPSNRDSLLNYLSKLQSYYNHLSNKINSLKDRKIDSIVDVMGRKWLVDLKNENYNKKLAEIMLNRNRIKQIILYRGELIRKKDPAFMTPYSHCGRAHFYAPYKIIGNWRIDTFWFNILVLIFYSILLYLVVYFEVFRKFFSRSSNRSIS